MFLKDYLSIDESFDYIKRRLDEQSNINRSAKTIIKNAIDLLKLKPVFKFKGYGVLYRVIKEEGSKNSLELKQVFNLSGYFYDSTIFCPSDFQTFTSFSNLDEPFFYSSIAIVDKLALSVYLTTYYLKNINDDKGYHAEVGKSSEIEKLDFESDQYLRLTSKLPVFNDFHQENFDSVEIPNQNVFLKISELDDVMNSILEPKDESNNSLINYLNFEQAIQFINETTNSYFEESNLIDLVANDYINPVIYFEGYASSLRNIEKSKYPNDFKEEADYFSVLSWQENRIIGYFHLMDVMALITNLYDYGNRFKVSKVLNQTAIPDKNLPNCGINEEGGIWYETPIKEGDVVQLFNYSDGFGHEDPPKFDKKDLRFSVRDIAKFSISLSSLSSNKKECSSNTDNTSLQIENNFLKKRIKILEQRQQSDEPGDDEPTHHKSVGSMQALITTLIKMAEYDKENLADPFGELNKLIQAKAEGLGLSVKKDFIAKWLKKAYEVL